MSKASARRMSWAALLVWTCAAATLTAQSTAPGPLPDDGKTTATITEVPITRIDPPLQGFFSKRLDYRGIPILGHEVVEDAAFYEAWRRIDRLLRHNPVILENLRRAGSQVHIIGRNQVQTDLPDFRSQKGVPLRENPSITLDERARGMGGRNCSCGEENLLNLPNDRYRGRDILSHEFTHTIHAYGLSPNVRELIHNTWVHAIQQGLWINPATRQPLYGGSNENEYLAELMLWYVGGRGDWPSGGRGRRARAGAAPTTGTSLTTATAANQPTSPTRRGARRGSVDPTAPIVIRGVVAGEPKPLPPMQPGPEFIKQYDPEGYKLVDDLVMGRLDVQPVTPRGRGRRADAPQRGDGATSAGEGRRGGR